MDCIAMCFCFEKSSKLFPECRQYMVLDVSSLLMSFVSDSTVVEIPEKCKCRRMLLMLPPNR